MRRTTIYTVRHDFPGRVSTMAHPAGGTTLAAELASLRARGTDLIVSALTEDEQTELDLLDEGETAAAAGLEYRALRSRTSTSPSTRTSRRRWLTSTASCGAGRTSSSTAERGSADRRCSPPASSCWTA
jgi:hypothetical protein